ncbi:MAG: cytochrome C oxidase subunit IV family protein [Sinimarinibacterium sp.]|jgi:hypothetical protein
MNAAFEKRLGIVWAILSAITAAQYLVLTAGKGILFAPNAALTTSVIVVSLVKVRLILREFMDVRHAPALLRRVADIWLAVTAASLLGPYLAGSLLWAS